MSDPCQFGLLPLFREIEPEWPPGITWRPAVRFVGPDSFVDADEAVSGTSLVFYRVERRVSDVLSSDMVLTVRKAVEGVNDEIENNLLDLLRVNLRDHIRRFAKHDVLFAVLPHMLHHVNHVSNEATKGRRRAFRIAHSGEVE